MQIRDPNGSISEPPQPRGWDIFQIVFQKVFKLTGHPEKTKLAVRVMHLSVFLPNLRLEVPHSVPRSFLSRLSCLYCHLPDWIDGRIGWVST